MSVYAWDDPRRQVRDDPPDMVKSGLLVCVLRHETNDKDCSLHRAEEERSEPPLSFPRRSDRKPDSRSPALMVFAQPPTEMSDTLTAAPRR